MKIKNIIVIGATGNVGRKVVEFILQRQLAKPEQLRLMASTQSIGKQISIAGIDFTIEATDETSFAKNDLCIFNTESEISAYYIPKAIAAGAYVIDSSSHYRLHPDVPLIIPPVNQGLINTEQRLYAHANCLASPIATALAPLHQAFNVFKANAVTYQSTSGAGKKPMDECWQETKSLIEQKSYTRTCFQRQIAFNVIPQVGGIRDDGYTFEEYKIIHEVKKVLGNDILMTSTAVRVPVMIGHSIALTVEFKKSFSLDEIKNALKQAPFVQLSDNHYSTPVEVVGSDDVFVGRIKRDNTCENGLHLWLCSDNLRRGAATDAVEIAEKLLLCLDERSKENYKIA